MIQELSQLVAKVVLMGANFFLIKMKIILFCKKQFKIGGAQRQPHPPNKLIFIKMFYRGTMQLTKLSIGLSKEKKYVKTSIAVQEVNIGLLLKHVKETFCSKRHLIFMLLRRNTRTLVTSTRMAFFTIKSQLGLKFLQSM